jgi:Domain of unknown function (DUF1996)
MARLIAAGLIALIGVSALVLLRGGGEPADARAERIGLFKTACPLSHRGPHDPIVQPRRPGQSHMHDFFGNRSTGASSTPASLEDQSTTCKRDTDRSGYWVPTLYDRGVPVEAAEATAYYRVADRDPLSIRPFPEGLMVVAGAATATERQPGSVISWGCAGDAPLVRAASQESPEGVGAVRTEIERYSASLRRKRVALRRERRVLLRRPDEPARRRASYRRHRRALLQTERSLRALRGALRRYVASDGTELPICSPEDELEGAVRFPECWDGRNLDSADHASHMAYARSARPGGAKVCPSSHPVPVPKLGLQIRYPIVGGPSVQLSAGDPDGAHADFMNGWDAGAQAKLVRDCLNADVYCSEGDHGP